MTEPEQFSAASDTQRPHKCGFVAIVGLPNAGKSTLMNRYLETKVSIVTPKPQTTRTNVTCFLSAEDHQVIFIDTPGILKPRYKMQNVMASFVSTALEEADIVLLLADASNFKGSFPESVTGLIEKVRTKRILVALNKIDAIKKNTLLPIMTVTAEQFPGAEIIPISALKGDGADELFSVILEALPEGPKLFPSDILSYEPEKFFVAELIREAVFLATEDEVPYSTAVIIDNYEDKNTLAVIHASILVEKKSQKPIIIGDKGSRIRDIGTSARLAVEEFLGKRIYLDLHVKISRDWRNRDSLLREAGLLRR